MIPLLKPHMPVLGQKFIEILNSGNLSCGEEVRRFESALSTWVGTDRVLAVNSFNSAVYVALTALGIKPGDEIIASPMGCLASLLPARALGAEIVWADVDPHTGTLDPDSVRRNIGLNTKAIIHNHFCGYPGHIDSVNTIARSFGIKVIDDAIEAFGSQYKNRPIGAAGADATVFSFGPVRIPNTIEGGAVALKDEASFEKAKLLRDCGVDRSKFRDAMGEIDLSCDVSLLGLSAKMSEPNAFIGLSQMKCAKKLLDAQRKNAETWEYVIGLDDARPIRPGESVPSWWVFGVLATHKMEYIRECRARGFYASGVHTNLSRYSVFGNKRCHLPGADEFCSRFVALPCGWWTGPDEILQFFRG